MDRIKWLIVELAAGVVLGLLLYGLCDGFIGSVVAIPEATGVGLVVFLALLVVIDIFLMVYTLRAWELD